ncbi:MAG TPA: amino acid ABC transporter substrate-binding protein, partial [Anaeromyxobacteraceae bacterium]|nr:amino acid ABC transporter substrate-binding protein [Anaeromyxobacteraceae bacterium]
AAAALAALAAATPGPAVTQAQDRDDDASPTPLADRAPELRPLAGTLARIHRRGAIRLGHRADAVPFSFLDARGRPVGYSLDLCRAVADDAARELGMAPLRVEYVEVTPDDRLSRVAAGEVDLECGSTTSTVDRQRLVAFSPTLFVSATRVLVRRDGPVRSLRDLRGRTVAVTRATTAVAVARDLSQRSGLGFQLVEARDYRDALELLASRRADALAGDEVLLQGLLAQRRATGADRFVGPPLSHEPYALAFQRDDPDLAALVARTFRRLAESREIAALYDRWFMRPLPSGERLGLPMGRELEELWRIQGLAAGGS